MGFTQPGRDTDSNPFTKVCFTQPAVKIHTCIVRFTCVYNGTNKVKKENSEHRHDFKIDLWSGPNRAMASQDFIMFSF